MIGGIKKEDALEVITNSSNSIEPIKLAEYQQRIVKLRQVMSEQNIDAFIITPGTSLYYFVNITWWLSERFFAAVITHNRIIYIMPTFEIPLVETLIKIPGEVHGWQEDEDPYALFASLADKYNLKNIKGDPAMPFTWASRLTNRLANTQASDNFSDGFELVYGQRSIKTANEIALLQHAKNVTIEVHKAAAAILHKGISNRDVKNFINQCHLKAGSDNGSTFCIVSFGKATAYPHGPDNEQFLQDNDPVLIDTGCSFQRYNSDITRSYVFGKASDKYIKIWNIEKQAQQAGFDAAQIGTPCYKCDDAVREVLLKNGLGPDYQIPGLPHRTGHGVGLDIHESPNLVRGEKALLLAGMCFSNEPNISIYGEFGIRLEDHFYMGSDGAKWFSQPSLAYDQPFN